MLALFVRRLVSAVPVVPIVAVALMGLGAAPARAQAGEVVDLPVRPGVTQRLLLEVPTQPRAVAVMLPGGHGGVGLFANGSMRWGETNFVVRTRSLFVDQGLAVAVLDAPSDRQRPPYLADFRHTPEHAQDIGQVVESLRRRFGVPVWLVGFSRGTSSAATAAIALEGARAPDGIVLAGAILADDRRPPLTALPLDRIRQPVLVVHHQRDGCAYCPFSATPALLQGLTASVRKERLAYDGGISQGDVCGPLAHHGFNGIEPEVVGAIARWMLAR